MRIKFIIGSYTDKSHSKRTIAALSDLSDFLANMYKNKKDIYQIYSLLTEKCDNMWYGKVLELPNICVNSYFRWLCVLKLKIMCMVYMKKYL